MYGMYDKQGKNHLFKERNEIVSADLGTKILNKSLSELKFND